MIGLQPTPRFIDKLVQGLGIDLRIAVVPALDLQFCDSGKHFISLLLNKPYYEGTRGSLLESIHQATDDLVAPVQVLASLCESLFHLLNVEKAADLFEQSRELVAGQDSVKDLVNDRLPHLVAIHLPQFTDAPALPYLVATYLVSLRFRACSSGTVACVGTVRASRSAVDAMNQPCEQMITAGMLEFQSVAPAGLGLDGSLLLGCTQRLVGIGDLEITAFQNAQVLLVLKEHHPAIPSFVSLCGLLDFQVAGTCCPHLPSLVGQMRCSGL
jgi:hypothetical protein